MNNSVSLADTLRSLADRDRQLLLLCLGAALFALTLGVLFGFGTGIARAGFVEFSPLDGYRLMTLHGATVFFTGCTSHRRACCWCSRRSTPKARRVSPGARSRGAALR